MSWFTNFFKGAPQTPQVLAAEDKVKSAQAELEAAKKVATEDATAVAAAPVAEGTAPLTGARRKSRKTRRSKKSKKSKRSRTGRKSSHP